MNGTKNSEYYTENSGLEHSPIGRFCAYYSEIEGLQKAHTLIYSADAAPGGAELRLTCCQDGQEKEQAVFCPGLSSRRAQQLLRYLYENAAGPDQWQELLADLGLEVQQL